nr:hypothetical protein [Tanacetum cinerariifolium]
MDVCAHCVTIESELKKDFIKNECYETLLQKYNTLEKHCISLEVNNQLTKEIFQRNTVSSPESAPTFAELFEINDLKAQAQAKDTMILRLKEKLRSLNGDVNERNKEESRNIDRKLALEKQVKELNNIVFKRSQSAQTVHMLTKPQVFYNHSTRQALSFQNPCYLKKAQQLKPKLYDGCVIEKSKAIVIPDTEETLMLAEENRSKLIEKQNDPQMIEKKTESSAEQAFWSQYSMQTDDPNLFDTTIVEVPKELPKVSMVNSCLKKLKLHLASFDMVVKERTTATAIIEGTWGFKHTKACFRDDIIPFVKSLKELFTSFDQCLIDEATKVQNVFTQMELAVEQHREEKTKRDTWSSQESAPTFAELFEINNLKAQAQAKDTMILKLKEKLNSLNGDVKERKVKRDVKEIENLNIELDHKATKLATENEHLKQTYNLQENVLVITALKVQLDKLKGKAILTEAVSLNPIDPELLKVDVAPLVPKLRKNRTAHTDYIRHTQEEAATLREIVESERLLSPLNTSLVYA